MPNMNGSMTDVDHDTDGRGGLTNTFAVFVGKSHTAQRERDIFGHRVHFLAGVVVVLVVLSKGGYIVDRVYLNGNGQSNGLCATRASIAVVVHHHRQHVRAGITQRTSVTKQPQRHVQCFHTATPPQ